MDMTIISRDREKKSMYIKNSLYRNLLQRNSCEFGFRRKINNILSLSFSGGKFKN